MKEFNPYLSSTSEAPQADNSGSSALAGYRQRIDQLSAYQRRELATLINQQLKTKKQPVKGSNVACLLPDTSVPIETEALHRYIQQRLPRDNQPQQILFTDKLPLNSQGNIDRRKLNDFVRHSPMSSEPDLLTLFSPPRTPVKTDNRLEWGPVPLLPLQHWFFERIQPQPHHWNQSYLFSLSETVNFECLERTVQYLLLHHDAMRMSFTRQASAWTQEIGGIRSSLPVSWVEMSGAKDFQLRKDIEDVARQINAGLDLSHGPLLRFILFRTAPGEKERLLIVAHQLVIDQLSWQILLDDLHNVYHQLNQGQPVRLPDKTSSIKLWAQRLADQADSPSLQQQRPFWENIHDGDDYQLPLDDYVDLQKNGVGSAQQLSLSLDIEQTCQLLTDAPGHFSCSLETILLCAVACSLTDWTSHPSIMLDIHRHDRCHPFDDIDLSRTLGCFTNTFPVQLVPGNSEDITDALSAVHQQLKQLPDSDVVYGQLRELASYPNAATLRQSPLAQCSFTYLGQADPVENNAWLTLEAADFGSPQTLHGIRPYLLEIEVQIHQGRLQIHWRYNPHIHQHLTIEKRAVSVMANLQRLIQQLPGQENLLFGHDELPGGDLDLDEMSQLNDILDDIDDDGVFE